jgi:isocitrate lyase
MCGMTQTSSGTKYDVFKNEAGGDVLWCGTAVSLEGAKAFVETLSAKTPGSYLVVNLQTGDRVTIESGTM